MEYNEEILINDIRGRLGEARFEHSLQVAISAKELALKYNGDMQKAYVAGLMHDVFKELKKDEAMAFFDSHGIVLSEVELNAPKLWHAMGGAVYLKETYGFPDDVISAVRYHTTGKENMSLLEKIIFVADFISADRNYDGVEDMRKRAEISLENAMDEGLRFTIEELAAMGKAIHPDTVAAYNKIIVEKEKNNG